MSGLLTPEQARFVTGGYYPQAQPAAAQPAPAKPTADPGKHTSAAARDAFGLTKISKQAQEVLEVVRIAHQAGVEDLTGQEIMQWWEKVYIGKKIYPNVVSGRLNDLISVGLLERLPRRICTVSNVPAGPVRAVAQQTRLVR